MNNLITVVIPTYNRSNELARLLHFLADLGSHFSIIILDGGAEASGIQNKELCLSFPNVEHHKFPSDLHLGKRLEQGLHLVKTPYVLFCGDDDFFFPDAVNECVNFLEKNQDYAAAIGQVWSLQYFPDKPVVSGGIVLKNDLNVGNSLSHERFILRALYYFAYTEIGSIPLFYAVRRTNQALSAFSLVTPEIKYSSMELLTNGMLLIAGKVAKLPIPFGLRDFGSITTRDPEREGTELYMPRQDLAYIRPLLVAALIEKEECNAQVAEYLIESLLSIWDHTVSSPIVPQLPRWRFRLIVLKLYFNALGSKCIPKIMASATGIPFNVYSALLKAHGRFTAHRK